MITSITFIALGVVLSKQVFAQGSKLSLSVPDSVVGNEGESVTLPCSITKQETPGGFTLRWLDMTKDVSRLFYVYRKDELDDPVNLKEVESRYSRQDLSIVISNFTVNDIGKKCCEVTLFKANIEQTKCFQLYYIDFPADAIECITHDGVKIQNQTVLAPATNVNITCSYTDIFPRSDILVSMDGKHGFEEILKVHAEQATKNNGRYSSIAVIEREIDTTTNFTVKLTGTHLMKLYTFTVPFPNTDRFEDDGFPQSASQTNSAGGASGKRLPTYLMLFMLMIRLV